MAPGASYGLSHLYIFRSGVGIQTGSFGMPHDREAAYVFRPNLEKASLSSFLPSSAS